MRKYTFEVQRHEEYDELGLALVGRRWAEPLQGMAVAHDILEHFPDDTGSSEEELMALGASIYVRDHGLYFSSVGRSRPDPGYQMSTDIVEQKRYMDERGESYRLRDPGTTLRCAPIEGFIEAAREAVQKEARCFFTYEEVPEFLRSSEWFKIAGWLRKGYRRAKRRYRCTTSYHLCCLFRDIEQQVDRALKCIEEGARINIFVDVRHTRARIEEVYDEE